MVSEILGDDYQQFFAPCGCKGLAKEKDGRLDILAVDALQPGSGQFREFIRLAKLHYRTVCVWLDMNPIIGQALARYGFTPETEIQADGEIITGWRWDKPTSLQC